MPATNVIIGGKYIHDETKTIMIVDSGSVPECDNWVTLSSPEGFLKRGFVTNIWRGTWEEFLSQWTEYKQLELPLDTKEYFKVPPIEDWRDVPDELVPHRFGLHEPDDDDDGGLIDYFMVDSIKSF